MIMPLLLERLPYVDAISIRIGEHESPQTIIVVLEPLDDAQAMPLTDRMKRLPSTSRI
jgi:hypothetical protein